MMLVFEHNHPHVLLLQLGNAFFKLPGGRLRPGEDGVWGHAPARLPCCSAPVQIVVGTPKQWSMHHAACCGSLLHAEMEGLKRKLTNNMAPEAASLRPAWDVGECIATFWRPNFDVALYPYLPAHITRPKEVKKLFLITMPERCYLSVRSELQAQPLRCWECLCHAGSDMRLTKHLEDTNTCIMLIADMRACRLMIV